jgi:hypothetical protein
LELVTLCHFASALGCDEAELSESDFFFFDAPTAVSEIVNTSAARTSEYLRMPFRLSGQEKPAYDGSTSAGSK